MTIGIRANQSSDMVGFVSTDSWCHPIISSSPNQIYNPNCYYPYGYTPPPKYTPPYPFLNPNFYPPPSEYTPQTPPQVTHPHQPPQYQSHPTTHPPYTPYFDETQLPLYQNLPQTTHPYYIDSHPSQATYAPFDSPPTPTTLVTQSQPEMYAPQVFDESPETPMWISEATRHLIVDKCKKMMQTLETMNEICKGVCSKPVSQPPPMSTRISAVDNSPERNENVETDSGQLVLDCVPVLGGNVVFNGSENASDGGEGVRRKGDSENNSVAKRKREVNGVATDESDVDDLNEEDSLEIEGGFGNIIVVDNLPVVPKETFENLEDVVRKIYSQIGVIKDDGLWIPVDPATQKTLGYCLIEYTTPQEAELAKEKTNGYKFDKAHIIAVNIYDENQNFEENWATADGYEPWDLDSEMKGEVGDEENEKNKEEKLFLPKEEKELDVVLKGPDRPDLEGIQGLPPLSEIDDIRYEKNTRKSSRADIERQKQEIEKYRAANPKIVEQFAELKTKLHGLSTEEWDSILEMGGYSSDAKKKKKKSLFNKKKRNNMLKVDVDDSDVDSEDDIELVDLNTLQDANELRNAVSMLVGGMFTEKREKTIETSDDDMEIKAAKKARNGGEVKGNLKRVAEIVFVLETLGKMRGGRSPTQAEVEMMGEARGKLAEVCRDFKPKDVFPREAFGVVIDDLGLSKMNEQMLGVWAPNVPMAQKLKLTQEKMGKSEEFAVHSASYSSQRLQTNIGAASESGSSHTVRMLTSQKPSQASTASVGLQPASQLARVSAANSTALPYQLPTSEVRFPVLGEAADNNAIVEAQTAEEVLEVTSEMIIAIGKGLSPSPLSPLNIATALHQIAKNMEKVSMMRTHRLVFARQREMSMLVRTPMMALPDCSAQGISNIAGALSKIGAFCSRAVCGVIKKSFKHNSHFPSSRTCTAFVAFCFSV